MKKLFKVLLEEKESILKKIHILNDEYVELIKSGKIQKIENATDATKIKINRVNKIDLALSRNNPYLTEEVDETMGVLKLIALAEQKYVMEGIPNCEYKDAMQDIFNEQLTNGKKTGYLSIERFIDKSQRKFAGKEAYQVVLETIKFYEGKMWSERPRYRMIKEELESSNFEIAPIRGWQMLNAKLDSREISNSVSWNCIMLSHFESKR